ncbi:MAG: DUF4382 domain-containing protein [Bacteroidota bacterium]
MKKLLFFLIPCAMLTWASCSKNSDSSANAGGNATMSVYLVDGPASFDKVYLDVQSVQVKASTDASEDNWQSLNIGRKGVYNLLDFKNGLDTLLGTIVLPAGHISQIRLVLGTNNSVVIGGVSFPLTTPSAQQSGLKLNINADLTAGVDYRLWIDFDAARSIVQTGAGTYILKPVIRTFTQAESGAIKGVVMPLDAKAWVYTIANVADTISSTPADAATGAYMFRGVPAATYKVAFHATNGTYRDTTVTNVVVVTGAATTIGTVTLK